MKLWEFVQRNVKEKVDYDKVYGCQCVDLFRQYCQDVLETPHTGSVDGAKDLFLKYDDLPKERTYFKKNKGLSGIKAGDVIIWNETKTNSYGHVAIFLCRDNSDVVVLEQNGFTQDGVKISTKPTTGILGYLRFRG